MGRASRNGLRQDSFMRITSLEFDMMIQGVSVVERCTWKNNFVSVIIYRTERYFYIIYISGRSYTTIVTQILHA